MALTSTTLKAAIDDRQTEFVLTSGTSLVVDQYLKVDSEFMLLKEIDTSSGYVRVERGQNGTLAVRHGILSLAVHGAQELFPPDVPWHIYTYGTDGAITVAPGVHRLAKGSAATMTLRAPKASEEGLEMRFVSASAYAHRIRLDSGAFNALTDVEITFNAAIGATVELVAISGSWMIASASQGTDFNLPSRSPSVSASSSASKSPSVSASKSPSVSPSPSS